MSFETPSLLFAFALLPVLWWLLRVTPPAPRRQAFPALRLLLGLDPVEENAARTPLWLLALRLLAAGLVILGLAGPTRGGGGALPGSGPLLLVIDNSWAASFDWAARIMAAEWVIDRAERAGRPVALLATAPRPDGTPPRLSPPLPAPEARSRLAAIMPAPWPPDRRATAAALSAAPGPGHGAVYLPDGVASADDALFARAITRAGPLLVLESPGPPPRLLLSPRSEGEALIVRLAALPAAKLAPPAAILAETGDGRALARVEIALRPGATEAEQALRLPAEIRNQIARLVLAGPASAAGVVLLDERWRRRPVGLATADATTAEAPLTGDLYYLRRALAPYAELRAGDLADLLARPLSVLMLADRPVDEADAAAIARFVDGGGVLVRFAGPLLAEHPDAFLPVRLIAGDRAMGGTMSWDRPAHLAAFPPHSPFAGLTAPDEVTIARQVLAEPTATLANQTWAALGDGTPLVTAAPRGAGWVVLFHVTANADWSNLPLSGLFIDMLRRIVRLSAGIAAAPDATPLAPAETLDGFGVLGPPPPAARPLASAAFASTPASPAFPPGLYGPENARVARNLATGLPPLAPAPAITPAATAAYGALGRPFAYGPRLLAVAALLLALDLLASLLLRGIVRAGLAAIVILCALPLAARAEMPATPNPALETRLAYVVTGDDAVDRVSKNGLAGLSDYVNEHTAASLAAPAAVTPGADDLSFYPLLYWPIAASAPAPPAGEVAALNDYMSHGGIILIDTRDADAGADFNPGGAATLARLGKALAIPSLAPLTVDHVLARTFYLLRDFPGRYDGAAVWVQRDQDRSNDSVSPVIIGANDWAAAWATDADGHHPYAVIPGGDRQRLLAYRFGVNLVMYALTGNYKGDQVHVPAILERLGQ